MAMDLLRLMVELFRNKRFMFRGLLHQLNAILTFKIQEHPTTGATLRRDAWYLGDPVTNIGNVTPSGAKIVLNMSGSASFAGAVDVGTFSSGTSGIRLTNTGTIYIGGTGNNAGLNIGNSAAVIDYDGSAAFAARFSPGTTSLNDHHAIVATNNNATNGVIVAQNMNNSGALFQGYNGSSVKLVDIFSDGNAIFRKT